RRSRRRRAQHVAGRSLTTAPLRAPWLSGGTAGADRVGGMNKRALLARGLAASAAAGIWGAVIEPHLFAVRRHTLLVLPAGAAPNRVPHVSDLHHAPWQTHRAAGINAQPRPDPDLNINTGDNLSPDIVPRALDVYHELIDVPGAFNLGSN